MIFMALKKQIRRKIMYVRWRESSYGGGVAGAGIYKRAELQKFERERKWWWREMREKREGNLLILTL